MTRLEWMLAVLFGLATTGCVREADPQNHPCPCSAGWHCCELDGAGGVCVRDGERCTEPDAENPTNLVEVHTPELEAIITASASGHSPIDIVRAGWMAMDDLIGFDVTIPYPEGDGTETIAYLYFSDDLTIRLFEPRFVEGASPGAGGNIGMRTCPGDANRCMAWAKASAKPVLMIDQVAVSEDLVVSRTPLLESALGTEDASILEIDSAPCNEHLALSGVLADSNGQRPFVVDVNNLERRTGVDDKYLYGAPGQEITASLHHNKYLGQCMLVVRDRSEPPQALRNINGISWPQAETRVVGRTLDWNVDPGSPDPMLGPGQYWLGLEHSHDDQLAGWASRDLSWLEAGRSVAASSDGFSLLYLAGAKDGSLQLFQQYFACNGISDGPPECPGYYRELAEIYRFESFPYASPEQRGGEYDIVTLQVRGNYLGDDYWPQPTAVLYAIKRATASGTELVIGSESLRSSPEYEPFSWVGQEPAPYDVFRYRWQLSVTVPDRIWLLTTTTEACPHLSNTVGYTAMWFADGRIYMLPFCPR